MFRCGAAATANDADPQIRYVMPMEFGEFCRGQVVVGATVYHAGESGVRQHADRHRRVLGQIAQVLLHLGRSGRAVNTDHIGPHRR